MELKDVTCESCGGVFKSGIKRYYCSHCDKYYHICGSCADFRPKCRFCSIPLVKKREPQKQRRVPVTSR